MNTNVLRSIGLTEGEIKVYLALVKLGESTTGPLGKESDVSKSKIYDILDKLAQKGLINHITRNGIKCFSANDPRTISDYLAKKEEELGTTKREAERLIKELTLQRATTSTKRFAEIYEGFQSMKTVREELIMTLRKGDEFLVLGAPKIANEQWEGWLLAFHKRREDRGVSMRIIYNANARAFGKKRKQFPKTKMRYLPNDLVSPNWIDIFDNTILFSLMMKEPLCIVIRDRALADSFRAYFNIMWRVSKE
jgi:sugar-specific transcriptional regulator TrmB